MLQSTTFSTLSTYRFPISFTPKVRVFLYGERRNAGWFLDLEARLTVTILVWFDSAHHKSRFVFRNSVMVWEITPDTTVGRYQFEGERLSIQSSKLDHYTTTPSDFVEDDNSGVFLFFQPRPRRLKPAATNHPPSFVEDDNPKDP
jgi:hypothetical protein